RLKNSAVCVKAGGVENRILGPKKARELGLKLLMDRLRPADEAHGRKAEAEFRKRDFRSLDQSRGIREAQIVVGAQVDDLLAVCFDPRLLRRGEHALGLVETFGLERGKLRVKMLEKRRFPLHS